MGIIRQHKPTPLEPPSVAKKVVHLAQAGARIVKAVVRGQPVRVSEEERERRLSICRDCDYWLEEGNIGLGECRHQDCGCSRFKHGFATEKCPLDKWPVLF